MTTKQLAEKIADKLMVNSVGQKAKRLQLKLEGERDGGGLCRTAIVSEVDKVLREYLLVND